MIEQSIHSTHASLLGDKLFLRDSEAGTLKEAYQSSKAESVPRVALIHGPAGVGKTALSATLRGAVREDGGYFISAKFDVAHCLDPLMIVRDALCFFSLEFVHTRSEDDCKLLRSRIEKMDRERLNILVEVVPEMRQVLRHKDGSSGSDASSSCRFGSVFQALVKVLSSVEAPLVVHMDDVHWAETRVVDMLHSLLYDSYLTHCVFVLTFRGDRPSDRIIPIFSNIEVEIIPMANFTQDETKAFLEEIVQVDDEDILDEAATQLFASSNGNPLLIRNLLRLYIEVGALRKDEIGDLVLEETLPSLSTNIEQALLLGTGRLPATVEKTLRVLSCLGCCFSRKLVTMLNGFEAVVQNLGVLVDLGIVICISGEFYKFASDLVHETVYQGLGEDKAERLHYNIGRQIWRNIIEQLMDTYALDIAMHLVCGKKLVYRQGERLAVAKICYQAGKTAVKLSSFMLAYLFLGTGVWLLNPQCWYDDYDFCVELLSAAAEAAYCASRFDDVSRLATTLEANARSKHDMLRMQSTMVYTLGTGGSTTEAIKYGEAVLKGLGVSLPRRRNSLETKIVLLKIRLKLQAITDESILRLPSINDPEKFYAMHILNSLFVYSFERIELIPQIAYQMVSMTLNHGISTYSSMGFAIYACLKCCIDKDFDKGVRYGRLAMKIQEKYSSELLKGRVMTLYYGVIFGFKYPCIQAEQPLEKAQRLCLSAGDFEFAMLAGNMRFCNVLDFVPMEKHVRMVRQHRDLMVLHGHQQQLTLTIPMIQLLLSLSDRMDDDFGSLRPYLLDSQQALSLKEQNNSVHLWFAYVQMVLSCLFGDMKKAYHHSRVCSPLLQTCLCSGDGSICLYYDCIVCLAYAQTQRFRIGLVQRVRGNLRRLKRWASKSCADNVLGKIYVVQAELAWLTGNHEQAFQHYRIGIAMSKEAGFFMQTALACERTGKFFVERGDLPRAFPFFQEALTKYSEWGADVKVRHLKEEIRFFNRKSSGDLPHMSFAEECFAHQ